VWSHYSAIIGEWFLKAGAMKDISFQHCLADADQVAHYLAGNVYSSKEFLVRDGDPPDFILPYVKS
jgi:hypothetical protein